MTPPLMTSVMNADRLELAAAGSWTAANADRLERLVDVVACDAARARSIVIDMASVEQLDTLGAWLLERLARSSKLDGREAQFTGLTAHYRGLIDEMQRVNLQPSPSVESPNRAIMALNKVGRTTLDLLSDVIEFVRLLGEFSAAIGRIVQHPRRFRLTSAVYHLFRVGWQAVPIMALITFLIGGIIAQQGFFHFRKFGADSYVVDMVGILVVREIGVLIVSIMSAGRSGAAYTAELGSMKMREEIDALRTMGFDPVEILILPRITALVCAANSGIYWRHGRPLWRRAGRLVLWRNEPRGISRPPAGGDLDHAFRSRHDQGAVHGAGDRHRGLRRGIEG
jgi:phospholipid/cholesterol/gamma-HCH transport system permease protein